MSDDWTSEAGRAEFRRLYAEATRGEWGDKGALVNPRFVAMPENFGVWPPGVRMLRSESVGKRLHTDVAATCQAVSTAVNPPLGASGGAAMAELIAGSLNALPALLDRIEQDAMLQEATFVQAQANIDARDALLRRCAAAIGDSTMVGHAHQGQAAEAGSRLDGTGGPLAAEMNTAPATPVSRAMSDQPLPTASDLLLRIQASLADVANAAVGLREITRDHGAALDDASNVLCRAVADTQVAFVRMATALREHGPLADGGR